MQRKRDIVAAERWRGCFNPNRACTRSGGSAEPDSSSVQAKRDFPDAKEQKAGSFNLNRACTRSVGSPEPNTTVQRRQSVSSQQQNSSRAVSNQIGHAPVRLEAVTFESREVRVSNTSHLTRPTEIQNSLILAKPAANRAGPCRKSEISQQQNGGGALSTQIGREPVRIEAQSQTAVRCRQNEI